MIDVALCFNDSSGIYYRYAATTILSILENTSEKVHTHIVHDESLSHEHMDELSALAEKYGQQVSFHQAPPIDQDILQNIPAAFGKGSLYRLYLHQLIDSDKVIYFDCDIICGLDIKELYAYELGSAPLAVVKDSAMELHRAHHCKSIGVAPTNYFNSGVLLINMQWMRQHGQELLNVVYEYFKNGKEFLFPDQDILNIFFNNCGTELLYLDEKFNYMPGFDGRNMDEFSIYTNKILHYTSVKPWKVFSKSAMFYWRYYSKTPWCEDVFLDIFKTSENKRDSLYKYVATLQDKQLKWIRRYYDYCSLGLLGYLKKRLFKKSAQKTLKA